jgi:membrane protein DedA with SNARE-associated domain
MKNKIRKSTWLSVILLIYVSVTAAYLLPRNQEMSHTEKQVTFAGAYVIVIVLWFVLRKKEQLQQKRRNEGKQSENLKQE